ncbi:hypothetical protein [Paraburkholderia ginsengiterrae]|nr:hypothetical protein [Paraburkholderia ginsengiterrae]
MDRTLISFILAGLVVAPPAPAQTSTPTSPAQRSRRSSTTFTGV